jgi:hypothetical protein
LTASQKQHGCSLAASYITGSLAASYITGSPVTSYITGSPVTSYITGSLAASYMTGSPVTASYFYISPESPASVSFFFKPY